MKFSIMVGVPLALLLVSSNALAQRDDQFVWALGVGATVPTGTAKDSHKTGAHGIGMFGIGAVDSPFGIRFDGFYSALGDGDDDGVQVDQGEARIFALMANGVFNLYGSNRRLYAVAGLGGFWYNPEGEGTSAVNDFGLGGGLGMWIPGINGFIEVRALNFYRALPDPNTGLKGKKSALLIPVTLGIMF